MADADDDIIPPKPGQTAPPATPGGGGPIQPGTDAPVGVRTPPPVITKPTPGSSAGEFRPIGLPPWPTGPTTGGGDGGWWREDTSVPWKPKSTGKRLQTIGGNNTLIPIIYGRQRVGVRVGGVVRDYYKMLLLAVWCQGEVDAIESVTLDNQPLPWSVEVTHYLGTQSQNPDPWLVASLATQGIVYTDTLRGTCYSVFRFPPSASSGFPRFVAQIRGMKVRSTEFGARAWSQNPALILADFIESTQYGWGKKCDWTTVVAAAADCDEMVGSPAEKRRQLDLAIDQLSTCDQWVATIRDYANCWVVVDGDEYLLISDKAGSSVYTIDETNILAGSENFSWRSARNAPTVVAIDYTDTTGDQYRDNRIIQFAPGVVEGTTQRRVSQKSMPGITRYSQANRYAIERLNEATLIELSMECVLVDDALRLQIGDIVTVTHPVGITAKLFRVMRITSVEAGRWRVSLVEYDPAKYSALVQAGPGVVDTTLPSPSNVPAVTNLVSTEDFYTTVDGSWASRIKLAWDDPGFPYIESYRVECFLDSLSGALAFVSDTQINAFVTPPLAERQQYVLRVTAISTTRAEGVPATTTITPQGKYALPSNVEGLDVVESGSTLYMRWDKITDVDLDSYEIRYGAGFVDWDDAILIDRTYALGLVSKGVVGSGNWDILVCARDTLGQYSATPARFNIDVTEDVNAFLLDTVTFSSPTLTAMVDSVDSWITSGGDDWNYDNLGPNWEDITGGIDAPWALPTAATFSEWLSESFDMGLSVGGVWSMIATVQVIAGSVDYAIELSANGSSWTSYTGQSTNNVGRYVRVRISSTGGAFRLMKPVQLRVDVSAREEEFDSVTSSASAAVTVTLANRYARAIGIFVTPKGVGPYQVSVDNILMGSPDPRYDAAADYDSPDDFTDQDYQPPNSFDINVFDGSNARVAIANFVRFKGV